jgi:hypothetical protein
MPTSQKKRESQSEPSPPLAKGGFGGVGRDRPTTSLAAGASLNSEHLFIKRAVGFGTRLRPATGDAGLTPPQILQPVARGLPPLTPL